ncbi:MAG: hypothetical protein EOO27_18535, partial [Comamonadaceae bacterium]
MSTLHPTKKFFASLAVVAVAALPLAACSSGSDSDASSDSSSSSSTPPKAVASITALTGEDTAVALDTGFTDALESLGLTPGTVGDGA